MVWICTNCLIVNDEHRALCLKCNQEQTPESRFVEDRPEAVQCVIDALVYGIVDELIWDVEVNGEQYT